MANISRSGGRIADAYRVFDDFFDHLSHFNDTCASPECEIHWRVETLLSRCSVGKNRGNRPDEGEVSSLTSVTIDDERSVMQRRVDKCRDRGGVGVVWRLE